MVVRASNATIAQLTYGRAWVKVLISDKLTAADDT